MKHVFFIVGPTAVGKSEIAAEVAQRTGAEVLSADAFQIYRGLDRLTAKPESASGQEPKLLNCVAVNASTETTRAA